MQIICSFYGIDPNIRCPGANYSSSPTCCFSASSFQTVSAQCNGRNSCTINGSPSFVSAGFANVCSGQQNMLYVQWQCAALPSLTSSTTTSTTASVEIILCDQPYIKPSGACLANHTPHVPSYLASSAQTYFDYPM